MKKKFFTLAFSLITICILSCSQSFAQDAGGSAGGAVGTPPLTFDFGTAGVVTIATTSPYYTLITSLLTTLHATIAPDGSVTFPTTTTYKTCLLPLYFTGCINYNTYQTCKYQAPPPCTYPKTTTCSHS